MFGEKMMLGNCERRLDPKGRVFMPKFTYAEQNDEIVILQSQYYLSIWNANQMKQRIETLKNGMLASENDNIYQKLQRELEELLYYSYSTSKIDSQKRALVPTNILIQNGFINDTVILEGAYDHIRLFPSQEDLNDFVMKLKK